ncbi:MAG: sigma-70 family RNA polymerase sigma factor [Acidobacteria bacterium]|nr:sigma-70 family RNA polymerase sigma factor [Acidobacteriota bacterium]
MPEFAEVTQILKNIQSGNAQWDDLLPSLYEELKRMAHGHLRNERQNHTLNTTALVHEAFFKLVDQNRMTWESRQHFLAIASLAMRRVLMTYAQQRTTDKRKIDQIAFSLEEIDGANFNQLTPQNCQILLLLDEALTQLEQENPKAARIVEYRFFGGLTHEEIGQVLGTSAITVRRQWVLAKTWLRKTMNAYSRNAEASST